MISRTLHGVILAALIVLFAIIAPMAARATGSIAYTYDTLGRITSATYDNGVIYYTYDAAGNRLTQIVNVTTGAMCWGTVSGSCVTATWGAGLWHN